jgi:hypothetical protein
MSRTMRATVATIFADSIRQTASIAWCVAECISECHCGLDPQSMVECSPTWIAGQARNDW